MSALGQDQGALVNVFALDIPARYEAGFEQDDRADHVGDDSIADPDGQMARGLPDVDTVVRVGGVADDALVFLIKGVHPRQAKATRASRMSGICREGDVLPCGAASVSGPGVHVKPGRIAKITVAGRPVLADKNIWPDVDEREIGHRIAIGSWRRTTSSLSAIQSPSSFTRILLRRASANSSLCWSGWAVRKRPTVAPPRGPCCQESPSLHLLRNRHTAS